MALSCPRCGNDSVTRTEETLNLPAGQLVLPKYTCTSCQTIFYFYENVIEYINMINRRAQNA